MKTISWRYNLILLFTVVVLSGSLYAQDSKLDVFIDSLENYPELNEQRIDLLNAIAGEAMESNIDYALDRAHEAREIGLEIGYLIGVANANKWLGKGNALRGKTAEALHNFMDALKVYSDQPDSLEMANVYKYIANVYTNHNNDREAMRYYLIAMGIYDYLNNIEGTSAILNNIGTIYLSLDDADSALMYLDQSRLSYLEIRDESGLATNYTNMGYAYAIQKDYEKALVYYNKSYELAKKLAIKDNISTALLNIGDGYMNLGEFDKAEENVKAGLAISEEGGFSYNNYVGYYTLGEINEKRGNYRKSLEWYHKAEAIDNELRSAAAIDALMDVQTMQLEQAQRSEIERINIINEERVQSEKLKNLLYLSFAVFTLLALLGLTYYYMKRHKASLRIAMQNKEINSQKELLEEQSGKIKEVNETLRGRNKKLRELNEEKNYMMSVVAHDLKSPLNQINGLANVIKLDTENLTAGQKECLDNIDLASSRLSEMVNKILDSRNVAGQDKNLLIEPVDIERMTDEVINDFSTLASKKQIKLVKNSAKNGAKVRADRHYLRQVLDNLVSNAIKFSPAGKNVEVKISDEGEQVMAQVVDEGPGLTLEDKEKLFTEYAVLSAKPTGGESSTGLGLAIVKNYVEKMGGEIWCDSVHGQGAAFKVKLDRS